MRSCAEEPRETKDRERWEVKEEGDLVNEEMRRGVNDAGVCARLGVTCESS